MLGPVSKEEIARKLRLDYQFANEDHTARVLDSIRILINGWGKDRNQPAILNDVAILVSKNFRIKEVAIGLRGSDGLYRMVAFVGYRPDTESANRRLVFKDVDFGESAVYVGASISPLTRAYFSEDNPYTNNEEGTYNRPALLKSKRTRMDESIEGDYFDTKICAPDGTMLGWIEYSGTTTWKLPDARSIKWIELLASILGGFLSSGGVQEHK